MNACEAGFEIRCALAVSGMLSERELDALREHAQACGECRRRLAEMVWVSGELSAARGSGLGRCGASKGMVERFRARAVSEGIPLRPREQGISLKLAMGVAAVAMVLVAATVWNLRTNAPGRMVTSASPAGDQEVSMQRTQDNGLLKQTYVAAVPAKRNTGAQKLAARGLSAGVKTAQYSPERETNVSSLFANGILKFPASALEQPERAFLLRDAGGSCDSEPVRPQLSELRFDNGSERRVFCYNPRIASLNSLDLLHAAASNMPRSTNAGIPLFRLAALTEQ